MLSRKLGFSRQGRLRKNPRGTQPQTKYHMGICVMEGEIPGAGHDGACFWRRYSVRSTTTACRDAVIALSINLVEKYMIADKLSI
jgi:hypothetical protein